MSESGPKNNEALARKQEQVVQAINEDLKNGDPKIYADVRDAVFESVKGDYALSGDSLEQEARSKYGDASVDSLVNGLSGDERDEALYKAYLTDEINEKGLGEVYEETLRREVENCALLEEGSDERAAAEDRLNNLSEIFTRHFATEDEANNSYGDYIDAVEESIDEDTKKKIRAYADLDENTPTEGEFAFDARRNYRHSASERVVKVDEIRDRCKDLNELQYRYDNETDQAKKDELSKQIAAANSRLMSAKNELKKYDISKDVADYGGANRNRVVYENLQEVRQEEIIGNEVKRLTDAHAQAEDELVSAKESFANAEVNYAATEKALQDGYNLLVSKSEWLKLVQEAGPLEDPNAIESIEKQILSGKPGADVLIDEQRLVELRINDDPVASKDIAGAKYVSDAAAVHEGVLRDQLGKVEFGKGSVLDSYNDFLAEVNNLPQDEADKIKAEIDNLKQNTGSVDIRALTALCAGNADVQDKFTAFFDSFDGNDSAKFFNDVAALDNAAADSAKKLSDLNAVIAKYGGDNQGAIKKAEDLVSSNETELASNNAELAKRNLDAMTAIYNAGLNEADLVDTLSLYEDLIKDASDKDKRDALIAKLNDAGIASSEDLVNNLFEVDDKSGEALGEAADKYMDSLRRSKEHDQLLLNEGLYNEQHAEVLNLVAKSNAINAELQALGGQELVVGKGTPNDKFTELLTKIDSMPDGEEKDKIVEAINDLKSGNVDNFDDINSAIGANTEIANALSEFNDSFDDPAKAFKFLELCGNSEAVDEELQGKKQLTDDVNQAILAMIEKDPNRNSMLALREKLYDAMLGKDDKLGELSDLFYKSKNELELSKQIKEKESEQEKAHNRLEKIKQIKRIEALGALKRAELSDEDKEKFKLGGNFTDEDIKNTFGLSDSDLLKFRKHLDGGRFSTDEGMLRYLCEHSVGSLDDAEANFSAKCKELIAKYHEVADANNGEWTEEQSELYSILNNLYKADMVNFLVDNPKNQGEDYATYAERVGMPTLEEWIAVAKEHGGYDWDLHKKDEVDLGDEEEGYAGGGGGGGATGEGSGDGSGNNNHEGAESEEKHTPLVVGRLNVEQDAREAAMEIAVRMWEDKNADLKGFKHIIGRAVWNLGKEARIAKFRKQAYEAIIRKNRGESTGDITLENSDWSGKGGIERFVMAYVNNFESEMIHRNAGETMASYHFKLDENGKETGEVVFTDANGNEREPSTEEEKQRAAAFKELRAAIRAYADPNNKAGEDSRLNTLQGVISHINHDVFGDGPESVIADNYLEVAKNAKALAEHEKSLDDVLAGFAMIDGTARRNVRGEVGLDKESLRAQKLYDRFMESGWSWMPPEVVGVAAGVATSIAKSKTRGAAVAAGAAAGSIFGPAGTALGGIIAGAVVSGTLSGIRERRRIEKDRNTLARRVARGEVTADERYDQELLGTLQERHLALDLANELNGKLNAENPDYEDIAATVGQIKAMIQAGDAGGIDIISYTSADTADIDNERMALDVALANAKVKCAKDGVDVNAYMDAISRSFDKVSAEIIEERDAKQKCFNKIRAKRAIMRGAKSAAFGALTSLGAQEIVAQISPDRVSFLEKLGEKTGKWGNNNHEGAQETFFASLMKAPRVATFELNGQNLSEEEIAAYRERGYTVTERRIPGGTETVEQSGNDYLEEHSVMVNRSWANNNTAEYDGNELSAYYTAGDRGIVTGMHGVSTGPNGIRLDFDDPEVRSHIKMFVTLGDGQAPIMVDGVPTADGQVEFISDNSFIQERMANHDFKWAEIAYDSGVNADGVHDVTMFATAVGDGGSPLPDIIPGTSVEVPLPDKLIYDVSGVEQQADRIVEAGKFFGLPVTHMRLTPGKRAESSNGEKGAKATVGLNNQSQQQAQPARTATPGENNGGENLNNNGEQDNRVENYDIQSLDQAEIYERLDSMDASDDDKFAAMVAMNKWNSLSDEDKAIVLNGGEAGPFTAEDRAILEKYGIAGTVASAPTRESTGGPAPETEGDSEKYKISTEVLNGLRVSLTPDEAMDLEDAIGIWNSLPLADKEAAFAGPLPDSELSDKYKILLNKYAGQLHLEDEIRVSEYVPVLSSEEVSATDGQIMMMAAASGKDVNELIRARDAWNARSDADRELDLQDYTSNNPGEGYDRVKELVDLGLMESAE